jgi:arylsulfatase A-like enzyme
VDIYPTLVELCGLPQPAGLQGDSLAPLLADTQAAWDKPAFSVSGNNNRLAGVAVRTERYRYVEYDGPNGGAMLFDESADPHETKNLAEEPGLAEVRRELAGKVEQFRESSR